MQCIMKSESRRRGGSICFVCTNCKLFSWRVQKFHYVHIAHHTSAATLVNPPVSDNSCGEAAARPLTPLGYNWGEQKAKINKSANTNTRKREIQMLKMRNTNTNINMRKAKS